MFAIVPHSILNATFYLTHEKAIFWKDRKSLIVADIHLGKTGHFRKSGIGVPSTIYKEDLHRLFNMLVYFRAEQLIVVGDMFHSRHNKEFELFKKWRKDCSGLSIELIKGNHDVVGEEWYRDANIATYETKTYDRQFSFVHDITEVNKLQDPGEFTFSGHMHPAVMLRGGGRQSLSFPCYYFRKQFGVLPAFSHFSGHMSIKPSADDYIFAIVNKSLIKIAS